MLATISKTEYPGTIPVAAASPSHRGRVWVAAAILAILVVVGIREWVTAPTSPVYNTAAVTRGDIDSTVTTSGNLNAVITVQVGSQVSGNILALYADFNTKVKKGQLVAEIDPAPFQAAVDQSTASLNAAQAAVVSAQATHAKAESDVASAAANIASQKASVAKAQSVANLAKTENDRRQVMVKNGSTSQEDADTSQSNYEQSQASIDAAQAALSASEAAEMSAQKQVEVTVNQTAQAEAVVRQDQAILAQAHLNLSHTRILAPVDGTVESRNMDVGQTVAASFQAPTIFLIAQDLTKMQVDTNVDEADVGRVHVDQAAAFNVDAWPGRVFRGRVSQIRQAPINVQNVITYDVVIEVSNDDLKLFPGMTANVTISVAHSAKALRLPKAALRFRPQKDSAKLARGAAQEDAVYVVDQKGQLARVSVKTGISDAGFVELISGDLSEGQKVVTSASSPSGVSPVPAQTGGKKMGL